LVSDSCPGVYELDYGDFAVIGQDVTAEMSASLGSAASILDGEKMVVIPRALFLSCKDRMTDG
jgi:hypothetical protein